VHGEEYLGGKSLLEKFGLQLRLKAQCHSLAEKLFQTDGAVELKAHFVDTVLVDGICKSSCKREHKFRLGM